MNRANATFSWRRGVVDDNAMEGVASGGDMSVGEGDGDVREGEAKGGGSLVRVRDLDLSKRVSYSTI